MTNKTTSGTIEVNHETGEHYIEIPAADWDAWTVIVDGEEIEMVLDFVEDDPNGDDEINIVTDWDGKPAGPSHWRRTLRESSPQGARDSLRVAIIARTCYNNHN